MDTEIIAAITEAIDFFSGQPIDRNADYGFNQLAEIALKALSPGINDPATAVLSLHSLSALLKYKITHQLPVLLNDDNEIPRIYRPASTFLDNFEKCIVPIWNYGKEDQYIQDEFQNMIEQLQKLDYENSQQLLFEKWIHKISIQKTSKVDLM